MGLAKEKQEKQDAPVQKTPKKRGRAKGTPQAGGHVSWEEKFLSNKTQIKKLQKIASTGANNDLIAGGLGVSRSAFYAALDRSPILREIIEQAKAERVNKVLNRMFEDAENGNTTAQIFIAKAQAGFKDRVDHVHSGTVKHEVELEAVKRIDQMTPEQRAARLEELRALEKIESEVIDVEVDT